MVLCLAHDFWTDLRKLLVITKIWMPLKEKRWRRQSGCRLQSLTLFQHRDTWGASSSPRYVPSPPVFHMDTDKFKQWIFLVPVGLSRYHTLAPFQRPLPPKQRGAVGAPSTTKTSLGLLAACWYHRGGSVYQMDHCLSLPLFCHTSSLTWGQAWDKLLFFFSSVIFNVFLLY